MFNAKYPLRALDSIMIPITAFSSRTCNIIDANDNVVLMVPVKQTFGEGKYEEAEAILQAKYVASALNTVAEIRDVMKGK